MKRDKSELTFKAYITDSGIFVESTDPHNRHSLYLEIYDFNAFYDEENGTLVLPIVDILTP